MLLSIHYVKLPILFCSGLFVRPLVINSFNLKTSIWIYVYTTLHVLKAGSQD